MKYTLKNITLAAASLLMLNACVNDLNVEPIDPSQTLECDQDALFNKIYSTLVQTGQTGPADDGDVDGVNVGYSSLYRTMFYLNEMPADGAWWNYYTGDGEIYGLVNFTWSPTTGTMACSYGRYYIDITLCNHYLEVFGDKTDEKSIEQQKEVRFIRAYNYSLLLDFYKNIPIVTKVTTEKPKQSTRKEVYDFVEKELLDLENSLLDAKVNEYRVDKYAAKFLLMRLYLNAEVYTGTAQWDKAAKYAAEIMDSPYTLSPVYAQMFMGDNNKTLNPSACSEFILSAYQNGQWARAYSVFCNIASTRNSSMMPYGSTGGWSCFRSRPQLLDVWFTHDEQLNIAAAAQAAGSDFADEFIMPVLAGDDRCMLAQSACNDGTGVATYEIPSEDLQTTIEQSTTGKIYKNGESFLKCWGICKWTALYSTGVSGSDAEHPDTDVPLFRASEAYLSYAEAVLRGGAPVGGHTAVSAVQALRDRAHCTHAYTPSLDNLLDEWQREFYFEGRRRTDLIRFGKWTSADYIWEGKPVAGTSAARTTYPIPESDIVANSNLKQYDWQ